MPHRMLFVALSAIFLMSSSAQAQGGGARSLMERCVDRVLTQLARDKTPDWEVGRAVLAKCEGALRDTLVEAMNSGEARGMCASVEACMQIARKRTADEAREAYRARLAR